MTLYKQIMKKLVGLQVENKDKQTISDLVLKIKQALFVELKIVVRPLVKC